MPDLRDGARTGDRHRGDRAQPRARRHDPALLDRRRPRRSGRRAGDGRAPHQPSHASRPAAFELAAARARDAGGVVGRLAVLRAGLGLGRDAEPQHVHADRARHRRRLALQRRGDGGAGHIPRGLPRHGRLGCGLFRGGRGHHGSRPARPGARAPRPRTDLGGDPRATRSRPQDRAADQDRRLGRRSDPRPDRHRRPPAGPAGREGTGRRLGHRRPVVRRRIDGDG